MQDKIKGAIFSLSGASIVIGVTGFLSAFVTLFVNINDQISIKWLLFSLLVSTSLIIIFLKIIYDLLSLSQPPQAFEVPINYVESEQVFVIRRNEYFQNSIVVGCYIQENSVDRLAYIGVVHLVQENIIQIKVEVDRDVLDEIPKTTEELKKLEIRPVVPVYALQDLGNTENNNG